MVQMGVFATRIVALADFRKELYQYLMERMDSCAPNLTALMGEQIGARLIAKAGSLIKLAKYPASTLQILGAEKALFRALKSKGACATPKYGLIYNSWAITAAQGKAKGKISRVLANKASMATRLDCFMDKRTNAYGKAFRQQVEDRLTFIKDGTVPPKNVDVMTKVAMQLAIDDDDSEDEQFGPATKKKKKKEEVDSSSDEDSDMEEFSLFLFLCFVCCVFVDFRVVTIWCTLSDALPELRLSGVFHCVLRFRHFPCCQ